MGRQFRLSMFMGLKGAPVVRSEVKKTHQTIRRLGMATGKAAKGQRRAGQAGKALAKGSRQARTGVRGLTGALGANSRKMREHVSATRRDRQALRDLRKEYRQLDRTMGKVTTRQKAMGRIRRGMGRASVGAAGLGVAAISPIKAAMRTEMAEFRLSTAINFDRRGDKKQQEKDRMAAVARAKAEAIRMAKAGITTIDQGLDIQYALNSAGLTEAAAKAGASVVGKVAVVTDGMPEQVGSVLATAYNNLAGNMAGTHDEKFQRLGDLLAQTQIQYQFDNFGQLGESMKYASATMAGLNVELAQGLNVIGALNSAGLKGSMAGTAFSAMMRGMPKAQKKLGIQMVRDKKGQLDLIATLQQIKDKTAHLSTDAREALLTKLFGAEGKAAVVPLIGKMDVLRASLAQLKKDSKGVVDENFARFAKTAQAGANRASGSISRIGDGIGTFLLPAVEGLLWTVEKLAGALGTLAEVAPTLTTIAGGAALTGGALMLGRRFLGGRRGGRKGGLLRRGGKGRGGLAGLAGGATPVMVMNWPGGGGYGPDFDADRRKRKGKGRRGRRVRGRGKFGRLRAMGRTATAARANLARRTGPLARRAVAGAAMAGMGKRAAAGVAKRAAIKSAAGMATKKAATKAAAGIAAKAVGRSVIKKIPFVSILAGLFFGAQRVLAGDLAGAAMEVASGVAATVPGAGTAASIGIDAVLAARDIAGAGAAGPAKRTPPDQEVPTWDEGWMRERPPSPADLVPPGGEVWTPWTGTIAPPAPPQVTLNYKPVINAPGGDPQAIKKALDPSGPHFKVAVEKAVNEVFVAQQRRSMANVGG